MTSYISDLYTETLRYLFVSIQMYAFFLKDHYNKILDQCTL